MQIDAIPTQNITGLLPAWMAEPLANARELATEARLADLSGDHPAAEALRDAMDVIYQFLEEHSSSTQPVEMPAITREERELTTGKRREMAATCHRLGERQGLDLAAEEPHPAGSAPEQGIFLNRDIAILAKAQRESERSDNGA